jgi:DNA-binding transcriptional regulator/RsmH inhibitor MraZ
LLSQRLRTYANIDADVVIAGQNKFLELWAPSLWEERVLGELSAADLSSDFFSTLSL